MKSVPENELFSAYLDGELTPEEQARIESLIDANAEAAALVRSLRAVSESIQALPQAPMPKELTATILVNIPQRMREAGRSPHGTNGTCDTDTVNENSGEEDERVCEEDEHLLVCSSIDSDQAAPDSNVTMEESVPQRLYWFQRFRSWTKRSRIFSVRLTSALLFACMTLGGLSWMIYLYDNGSHHVKMIAQNDTMEDKTSATASVQSVERENAAVEIAQEESYEALSNDSDNVLGDSTSRESSAEQTTTVEQNIAPHDEMENATKTDGSHFAIHAQSVVSTPATPASPQDANQNAKPTINNRARSFRKEMSSEPSPAPRQLTSSPVPPASLRMSSVPPQEEGVTNDSSMDFDLPKMTSNSSMYSMRNSISALESSAVSRDESVSEAATQTAANPEANPSTEAASVPKGSANESVESMVANGSPNIQTMEKIHADSETNANSDVMPHPHKEFSHGGLCGQRLSGMGDDMSSDNMDSVRAGLALGNTYSSNGDMSSDNMNTVLGRMRTAPERSWSEPDIHEAVSVNEILQSDPMGNDMENIRGISSDSSVRDSMSTDKSEVADEVFRAGKGPSSALYREQGHDRSRIAASKAIRTCKSNHPWVKNLAERFAMVLKFQNSIHAGDPSTTENVTISENMRMPENTMTRKSEFVATVVKVVTTSTLVAICPRIPSFCLGAADIMYTSIRYHRIPLIDDLPTEK